MRSSCTNHCDRCGSLFLDPMAAAALGLAAAVVLKLVLIRMSVLLLEPALEVSMRPESVLGLQPRREQGLVQGGRGLVLVFVVFPALALLPEQGTVSAPLVLALVCVLTPPATTQHASLPPLGLSVGVAIKVSKALTVH